MGKFLFFFFIISSLANAKTHRSKIDYLGPNEGELDVSDEKTLPNSGFNELLQFIHPSPDQEDAGSCLYMATTGIVEWWLTKLNPNRQVILDGPLDLSERYTMNMAGKKDAEAVIKDWRTDTVLVYNVFKRGVENQNYRYTKGYYLLKEAQKPEEDDQIVAATAQDPGVEYGTFFNWIDDSETVTSGFVDVPQFKRTIIFADPEHNQWNTGVAPLDIVDQVKTALTSHKAPVLVIYNHYGYWHAVYIVGFDDTRTTSCEMTKGFAPYMEKESTKYLEEARTTQDVKKKESLEKRAAKYAKMASQAQKRLDEIGGCKKKGVFYVRDSIYPDSKGPIYDYDLGQNGEEGPYSKRVILREYEWLTVLSNHLVQVTL